MKFTRTSFVVLFFAAVVFVSARDSFESGKEMIARELRALQTRALKHKKAAFKIKRRRGNKYHRLAQAVKAIRRAKRKGQKLIVRHKTAKNAHRLVKAKRAKNRRLDYTNLTPDLYYNPNTYNLFSPAGTPKFEVYPPIQKYVDVNSIFKNETTSNMTDVMNQYKQNQIEIARLKYLEDWRNYERERKKALYNEYQGSRDAWTDIQSVANNTAAGVGKVSGWVPDHLLGVDFSGNNDYVNMGLGTIGLAAILKDKYQMNGLQNASTEEENQSLEFINKKLNYAKKKIIRVNKAVTQRANDIDNPLY